MADKRITDFPTLPSAQDNDLLLIGSEQETYNIKMLTLRKEALDLVQDTVDDVNQDLANVNESINGVHDEINALSRTVESNRAALLDKVDGAYVGDDGCLYLTSDDSVVAGPLGPFAGGGGGSGGGSGGNNATLTLTNTTGWLAISVAQDADCIIKASWSSIEAELPTGAGTLTLRVNGTKKLTKNVEQGDIELNIKEYLSTGSNSVRLTVTDAYGNNRTLNFSVTVVLISLTSTFDAYQIYTQPFTFIFTPVGSVEKTVHILVDEKEIGTLTTMASGRQQSCQIPAQTHGAHKIRAYFTCSIDGAEIQSNDVFFEIFYVIDGNMTPLIASNYHAREVMQYTSVAIDYRVYNPAGLSAVVKLYENNELVSTQTVDRTEQTWTYRPGAVGTVNLAIKTNNGQGSASRSWTINVTESDIDVSAETEDLALYLSSYGRSNNEANPGVWSYGAISATFTGFNFKSDGWQLDKDKISVLRVAGDARLTIPLRIFGADFRGTGKTIEFDFYTSDVMDANAVILSCMADGRGIDITAQEATLTSEQSEISTRFKEDEHVRISFVVEKRSANRLIYIYINGIASRVIQYPADDDFSQQTPVGITIGSNDCTINLYCIRVYDNDLTRYQMLDNWIADKQDIDDLLDSYARNHIFNAYGDIVIEQLPEGLAYMVLQAPELPAYKGDKKTISGYYVDPAKSARSFTFEGAEANVQGTSSAGYERKNYKIKFKGGFLMEGDTEPVKNYALRGEDASIPTNTFTFKADVASSEGANNVELVRLYNDICPYKTPPQQQDARIRQGIDGFPILMFWDDGTQTTFIGKYNFNNDKGTEEVYGFSDGDESWEILNNTSSRVNWKSADFSGDDWLNDFEGRYPDANTDCTNLAALSAWINSTDRTAATGNALAGAAEYDGVTYTTDTAEYRLAKFKAEVSDHFEKTDLIFNYLFTELFLMVDNRAKNAFPTFFNGHKWCIFPYDYDTAIGINNEGALVFGYELEDTDTVNGANVYNGQESVLWNNVRDAFFDDIAAMYQTLRSNGALSYADTEKRFEDHQSAWPEAVFNEDAWFKYLAPLVEKGNGAYLSMLQGSKAEQRKWWLYNRYRYIDSKYVAGDALADYIMLRAYAKSDITVTPYADIYAAVKYGSYMVRKRALQGASYTLDCPLDTFNDTEIYIYSASQLKSIGDLSDLKVGYADFSHATRLQSLVLGRDNTDAAPYENPNLQELYVGNNALLKKIDVRNCPNLTQAIDLSGCPNLEFVRFVNTSVTGLSLPTGGMIKTLYVPATLTNLTIINQPKISLFSMWHASALTTLRLENVSDAVTSKAIVAEMAENSRVRIIGFNWEFDSIDNAITAFDHLDTMRGLDEYGNNVDKAQLQGTVHVPSLTGSQLADLAGRYPSVIVTYDHITSYCYFYTYDGATLLYTAECADGADAVFSGANPTRASTAQYTYTFAGWSLTANGSANSNALKNVTADRKVYAAYTAAIRKYTVKFYNGSTLLQTVTNVAYGSSATYTGGTPVSADGSAEDYPFEGWQPTPTNITGNTSCYAQFGSPLLVEEITDSWEDIIAACQNGTYKNKYKLGMYKYMSLGTATGVNMQIAGIDVDDKADGSGKAPLSWVSKELYPNAHRWNPSLHTVYKTVELMPWISDPDNGDYAWKTDPALYAVDSDKKPLWGGQSVTAYFDITAVSYGDITITYSHVPGYKAESISLTFGSETLENGTSGTIAPKTHTVSCSPGDVIQVKWIYNKSGTYKTPPDDVGMYIAFTSTGTINVKTTFTVITRKEAESYTDKTGPIGGWQSCELRTFLKDNILPLMPQLLQTSVLDVTKTQTSANTLGVNENQESSENIWVPTWDEIRFVYNILLWKGDSKKVIKYPHGSSTAQNWWTRGIEDVSHGVQRVSSTGMGYGSSWGSGAGTNYYFPICFCT